MVKADLTKKVHVDRIIKGMDFVIQAAAVTSGVKDIADKPHTFISDNAVMNSLILRSAFDYSIKHLVLLSCSVMYQSSELPLKESDFDANEEMYPSYFGGGWNKVYFEKICEFYSRLGDVKYTALRHSNIYGPYDKFDLEQSHVFGASITKVLHCIEGQITIWGDGSEERDLLYVSDLVDFVERVIERQDTPFHLLNVGYGSAISISDLVDKIIKISGKNILTKNDTSKPTIPTRLALDCGEAKRIFGWEPKVSLDEGIRKTMDWHKSNIPVP